MGFAVGMSDQPGAAVNSYASMPDGAGRADASIKYKGYGFGFAVGFALAFRLLSQLRMPDGRGLVGLHAQVLAQSF